VELHSVMNLLDKNTLELSGGLVAVAVLAAALAWGILRKRPTEAELERGRRGFLVQSGRLVDGMLLDICETDAGNGHTLTLLIFSYRIGGVDYECSQDITLIHELVNDAELRVGYPCTVRYQPGNPQNSIVVAEAWSGLRAHLPQLKHYDAPPIDKSHLFTGKSATAGKSNNI
jgi:hypothetical protein